MNEALRDNIRNRVDRIFCLTCPQSIDSRYPSLEEEFDNHGLLDMVLPFPNVHSVIEHAELDRRQFANDGAKKVNVKNCTLGHYHMAKFAMDAGYDSVMLIEDDCRFLQDDDLVLRYLEELPGDTNSILSYQGFPSDVYRRIFSSGSWKRWAVIPAGSFFDLATCYILNRGGIESLVRHYETAGTDGAKARVDACDRAWPFLSTDVPVYIPKVPIFVPSGSQSVTNSTDV